MPPTLHTQRLVSLPAESERHPGHNPSPHPSKLGSRPLDGLGSLPEPSREQGRIARRIAEEDDPNSHPLGREIVVLIERWKLASGHAKSKTSADRVKLVKARLKDDYSIEQLELAIDGIAAYPYVGTGGQRFSKGKPGQRHDRLGIALGGGEAVEKFAVLGHEARGKGWTPEGGWPA